MPSTSCHAEHSQCGPVVGKVGRKAATQYRPRHIIPFLLKMERKKERAIATKNLNQQVDCSHNAKHCLPTPIPRILNLVPTARKYFLHCEPHQYIQMMSPAFHELQIHLAQKCQPARLIPFLLDGGFFIR